MDQEFKAEWVEALRSGEFKQTKGVMESFKNGRMCCLGVLTSIVTGKRPSQLKKWEVAFPWDITTVDVCEIVGLSEYQARELAKMNDRGRRFSTIANYIEKNL